MTAYSSFRWSIVMQGGKIPDPNIEKEYLAQCWEDWRQYDSIMWHSPSVTAAVVGALVGIAFYAVQDLFIRGVILILASVFALAMTIGLHKHRYFQGRRTEKINEICMNKLGYASPIRGESKWRAYYFLFAATLCLFIFTLILGIAVFLDYFV